MRPPSPSGTAQCFPGLIGTFTFHCKQVAIGHLPAGEPAAASSKIGGQLALTKLKKKWPRILADCNVHFFPFHQKHTVFGKKYLTDQMVLFVSFTCFRFWTILPKIQNTIYK